MNLDFLTPATEGDASARSPMEQQIRSAGVRFERRDGWELGVEHPSGTSTAERTVGWADVSHLPKLELTGDGAALETATGGRLPFSTAIRRGDAWWCRLTQTRALVIGATEAITAEKVDVIDVTSTFAAVTVVGPQARETLARFCALDLRPRVTPVGALRPGSVGRQPATLIREGQERYLFLFGWATAEYMWSVVADAGGHLGGQPLGVDQLAAFPIVAGEQPPNDADQEPTEAARDFRPRRMWRRQRELKSSYDVVIIGGGSHGLATAHYLREHGIKDIAILEKRYIGSGAAGRNTTILRSNYKTPQSARFYDASLKLYEGLSQQLNFNMLFSQCGHLTLAHSDRAMFVMANRAEVNRLNGIDSRLVDPDEIKRLAPAMQVDNPNMIYPVLGALYHPPGGIIRHDAVVWGLARSADRGGAEIHQNTEVLSMERSGNRITKVVTDRGTINAGQVLNCTAGWSTLISDMAGVPLPITTHILQACVTEAMKPLLDVVIVSSQMHVYISQTDRGEFLMGAEIEPWTTYRQQGTLNFLQDVSRHSLELFPQLERARLLRSWAGLCDISPDFSPIIGQTEVENFHVSAGWGTYGFKAAPIVGKTLAELVATGKQPELIEPFRLERFYEDSLVSELAAAAVSH